jgi:hypothetical protein
VPEYEVVFKPVDAKRITIEADDLSKAVKAATKAWKGQTDPVVQEAQETKK